MYELVTDRTELSLISSVETDVEALYQPISHTSQCAVNEAGSLSAGTSVSGKTDLLRQYVTSSELGFYFDIRFSHDEFHFVNAMSKWVGRITANDLTEFPDMAEMVIRHFRDGYSMEYLPVNELRAYSERWERSFWLTIQAYKKLGRDLHEHYQLALKSWGLHH